MTASNAIQNLQHCCDQLNGVDLGSTQCIEAGCSHGSQFPPRTSGKPPLSQRERQSVVPRLCDPVASAFELQRLPLVLCQGQAQDAELTARLLPKSTAETSNDFRIEVYIRARAAYLDVARARSIQQTIAYGGPTRPTHVHTGTGDLEVSEAFEGTIREPSYACSTSRRMPEPKLRPPDGCSPLSQVRNRFFGDSMRGRLSRPGNRLSMSDQCPSS